MKQTDCQKVEKKSKKKFDFFRSFLGSFWGQIFEGEKCFLDSILTSFRKIEAFGIFYAFEYNCLRVESVGYVIIITDDVIIFLMTSS